MKNSLPRRSSMTLAVVLVLAALAQTQTFTTLHSFTGSPDGGETETGIIQAPAGNLYGTTIYGGIPNGDGGIPSGDGVVYKVNTAGRETVLHSFTGPDGDFPFAPLTMDGSGNIYGTTFGGGFGGYGTVFKIDTAGNETVLYSFTGGSDGCEPAQGLVRDRAGNLYGTTFACGSSDDGTIFKVDHAGTFVLLHSFSGYPSDGAQPEFGRLAMDEVGNLYGTASNGASDKGALYKLSKSGKLTLLYSFKGGTADGCNPYGVVRDQDGNLYGTTDLCGSDGGGTIWKVSKKGKETILHNFAGGKLDGCIPLAGVTRDSKGNLYGLTNQCGANNYGALYKLSTSGELTLLHSFDYKDGAYPLGEVLRTTKGTLFGISLYGGTGTECGTNGCGTVWKYVP